MKLMEVNPNNIGKQIEGIAWRLKNVIVDKLRELQEDDPYPDSTNNDVLKDLIEQLTGDAEELDFIGGVLANCTDEDEK